MRHAIGIDASLTGTAVCAICETGEVARMCRWSSEASHTLEGRIKRYEGLAEKIITQIGMILPDVILLEGYSFGSRGASVVTMGEFGGVLRSLLVKNTYGGRLIECPPNNVKLFAAGKGNADKLTVAVSLSKRYGVEFKTSDEYDAYALARMAACIAGFDKPQNDAQKRAIDSVLNGKPKKPKHAHPQPAE